MIAYLWQLVLGIFTTGGYIIVGSAMLIVFVNIFKGGNNERRVNTSDERLRNQLAERRLHTTKRG